MMSMQFRKNHLKIKEKDPPPLQSCTTLQQIVIENTLGSVIESYSIGYSLADNP